MSSPEGKALPRFEVGYRLKDDDFDFMAMARHFRTQIDTVYFPWMNLPSGRAAIADAGGFVDWGAQARLEEDLRRLKEMGLRLNLLFNGSCYGALAVSRALERTVVSVVSRLEHIGAAADIVTTCSPAIAAMVKEHFPRVLVRASVNMRIGTVEGMAQLADYFDEYNVQREYNRVPKRLRELRKWADKNGKGLVLLANSGCFNFCPSQTFHDNLVAHESEICRMDNLPMWARPNCRRLLEKRENWRYILQGSWIRPEDLSHYTADFPVIKLATRMHQNPWMVLHAYTTGCHPGALTDLLEPAFSQELAPFLLDNRLFPDDWYERTAACDKRCDLCGYCEGLLDRLLVDAAEYFL